MRVLFSTFAVKSHMHAQVPLAWALQTAGHEVVIASQPDLADDITRTGLTAVSVGEPLNLDQWFAENDGGLPEEEDESWDPAAAELLDMSEIRPEKLTWGHVHGVFNAMTNYVFHYQNLPPVVDDLVRFARAWQPDLVIWDTLTFAGPVAAKAAGAAHARLLFALDLVGRMRSAYHELAAAQPAAAPDDPLADWLRGHAHRHGCDFDESMVVGQWTICPVPSSMRFPVDLHYVPVRYVPYGGAAKIPSWLQEPPRGRRVCLTLGVAKREVQGHEYTSIADLLAALGEVDAEVVATLNAEQLAAIGQLPPNVRAVDFVPLKDLLSTCSAIIHHGGSGTFQTALAAGVPQVIVPDLVWDTIHKATALEAAGAGLYVRDVAKLTGGELRSHVQRLLDEPSFAASAQRIRTEMVSTPSPNELVPVLERLTRRHRRR